MSYVRRLLRSLTDVVLPPLCHVCRSFIPDADELHICPACRAELPFIARPSCSICGIPFSGEGESHPCGACLTAPPLFDAAAAPLLYAGRVAELIHDYKYLYKTHLRRPLALLMVQEGAHFLSPAPEAVMPVPLHRSRLRQRGFNQALLLAEVVAGRLRVPLVRQGLLRTRPTEPQVNLSADERRQNVRGAFSVPDERCVAGRRILLVDDVLTTGSTANECARVLKAAGARDVRVATAARAGR